MFNNITKAAGHIKLLQHKPGWKIRHYIHFADFVLLSVIGIWLGFIWKKTDILKRCAFN